MSNWPNYDEEQIQAVHKVLKSGKVNYWTGNECRDFEQEFADWAGTSHAVSLTNGTVALDVALKALEIGSGDEVIVTPRSFIASVSSVVNCGATPIFADIDRDSQNLTAGTIAKELTERTRAILLVHIAGWPCEMDSILDLARASGLVVIEDCAQAHGARYNNKSVGSFGNIGAWSFCQDKIISTGGEGGMVTTNDRDLWSHMWSYKDHGKSWSAVFEREHAPGYRWLHESFGTNWRMLELQAAIGRIQLRRLPAWHEKRRANAAQLAQKLLLCNALRVPLPSENIEHAWYRFCAFVEPLGLKSGWSRDRIMMEAISRGVPCSVGSCAELYLEKAFDGTGWRPSERLPVARELGETSLAFPVDPSLTELEIAKVGEILQGVLRSATR